LAAQQHFIKVLNSKFLLHFMKRLEKNMTSSSIVLVWVLIIWWMIRICFHCVDKLLWWVL